MQLRSRIPVLSTRADSRTAILQGLLIATLVIGALYVGREVLVPLALAILLSFVLTRPLVLLRRFGVPRILAVAIVVSCAFAVIFGLGWLLSREFSELAADLPGYRNTLSEKIKSLRDDAPASPVLKKAGDVLTGIQKEFGQGTAPPAAEQDAAANAPDGRPIQVEVRQPEPTVFELLQRVAGTVLPPLATAGIVFLFVIFILVQRDDLRDRFIRLLGSSDLQRATVTLDDATTRLSKYFLRQLLINSAFGAFIALALWAIGIPGPPVWGVLAMLMRFVPFVGSYIGAIPPLLLAAVVDPGWSTFLMVLALYVVGEMIMGQVVEPLVFGHGTGVSPIAVLVSTVFWTWLWGPLGLLLAMPITVCLAVLGRHVEDLHMFEVLLGDEPALTPDQAFYQRALSGDAAEATYQAELQLKEKSFESGLDDVVLAGLKLAERDARRGLLDAEKAQRISETVREILDNLADFTPRRGFFKHRQKENGETGTSGLASLAAAEAAEDEGATGVIDRATLGPGWQGDEAILCLGGRNALDEAAAALLAEILKKRGLGAVAPATEAVSAGHIASLAGTGAKLVCLCYLGLGAGPAHIRYLVRRLKRLLPAGTSILVAVFGDGADAASVKELLEAAEADAHASALQQAADIVVAAAKAEAKSEGGAGAASPAASTKAETKSEETAKAEAKSEGGGGAASPCASPEESRALEPAIAGPAGDGLTGAAPAAPKRQQKQAKAR